MKAHKSFLFGVLMTVLASMLFWAGTVYATTGCFPDTNGHWAETFICWMKDNGISSGYPDGTYKPSNNVTRAEMAVMLQKLDDLAVSQAQAYTNNAFSTGVTYISAGNNDWLKNGASANSYVQYYTDVTRLRSTAAGSYGFQVTASLPDSLFNHLMYLNGVQFCYDATNATASVSTVYLQHYSGGANPTLYKSVVDNTTRDDATCRTYSIATPGSLWGSDHVVLYVVVNFTDAAGYVDVPSTTFILSPSTSPGHAIDSPDVREPGDNSGPAAGASDSE